MTKLAAQPSHWQVLNYPSAARTWCFGMNPSADMVGQYSPTLTGGGWQGFALLRGEYYPIDVAGPLPWAINAPGDIAGDLWTSASKRCSFPGYQFKR